jgi:acyl-CoA synthetase (AMP-forming)/AMP-acid ligase II
MLPNRPEFVFAFYGALMAGATVVLYNVMLKPGEIEYLARDSGTKVIVALDGLLPGSCRPRRNTPGPRAHHRRRRPRARHARLHRSTRSG